MPKTIYLSETPFFSEIAPEEVKYLPEGESEKGLTPKTMRRLTETRGFHYPKKNIIFHCLKGGAAKTTLAYNTAYRLSQLGTRVLLVDLDRQANATHVFLAEKPRFVFIDLVTSRCPIEEAIVDIDEYLALLPSSLDNARLELELANGKKNPRTFYHGIFSPVRDKYDVVIVDLPPDLNHNTYLSSLFADVICIPTTADEFSVYGMKLTLSSLDGIWREYEDLEQEVMIIWSKFDPREKSSLHHIAELKDLGKARVFPIVIRSDVTVKHAQERRKSLFQLKKQSAAREDLDILARELIGLREFFGPRGHA